MAKCFPVILEAKLCIYECSHLCDACRRLQYVTVPCDECGAETTVPLSVFRGRRHNGQKVLCSSCHRNTFR